MACLPTHTRGELEFVRDLNTRSPRLGECRGPLLRIAFWPHRVFILEHIFDSRAASDILWDGFCSDGAIGVHFELCGAHWLDLAVLCEARALQYRRSDWTGEARTLLNDVCTAAGWDAKEIANMLTWLRVRLT